MNQTYQQTPYPTSSHESYITLQKEEQTNTNKELNDKEVFELLDPHLSQQIQISNKESRLKMAAIRDSAQVQHTNEQDSGSRSYPYFQNYDFQKQSANDNVLQPKSKYCEHKNFTFQQQSHCFSNQDNEAAFLLSKGKFNSFHSTHQIPEYQGSTQINHQDKGPQFMVEEEHLGLEQNHTADMLGQNQEMARLFSGSLGIPHPSQFKDLSHAQTNNRHYLYHTNQPSLIETSNRVRIPYIQEVNDQFITPKKGLVLRDHEINASLIHIDQNQNSSKNIPMINQESVEKTVMPIHVFGSKSSKPKILDFQKPKPQKNSQCSKALKIAISKMQTSGDEKKTQKIKSSIYDSNRRMKKIKSKKKGVNKSEPIIEIEDHVQDTIEMFKKSLSVQTYEIGYLNSLEDFNKKLKLQRQQSLSLKGNVEQMLISSDTIQEFSFKHKSFNNEIPQFSEINVFSNKIANSERKKNKNTTQKYVTFQNDQDIIIQANSKPLMAYDGNDIHDLKGFTVEKKVKCNCQKNNCTQGYCDCLKNNQACDPSVCQCVGCKNTPSNHSLRIDILEKHQKQGLNKEGCNCKNSQCLKKYCECYQDGKTCDPSKCKCQNCKNDDESRFETQRIFAKKYTQ